MNIKLILIVFSVAIISSCSTQKPKKETPNMEQMNTSEMAKSQTIKLKKGELFVAVVGHQMAEKEALLQEYFGIVFPPAQKNGFAPLGQLPIDEVASGSFIPNEFVGLFKWPGMAGVQAFMSEISPDELHELRVKIWSELKQHVIMVSEDLEMTFKENKIYEVKMVWTDKMLNTSNINDSGGRVIFNSPVAMYEDLGGNKTPNNLLIVEWNSKKNANSYRNMNNLEIDKEEAFYTHFTFPKE